MKKRRDQCIQVLIRHPGLKSDSWVGDFEVAIQAFFTISSLLATIFQNPVMFA